MEKIIFFVILSVILIIPLSANAVLVMPMDGSKPYLSNPTVPATNTQTTTPATIYTPNYVSTCTCPDVSSLQYQINNLLGRVANLESNNTNLNTEVTDLQTRLTKLETGGNGNSLDIRVLALETKYTALQSFIMNAFAQILQAIKQLIK